MKFRRHIATAVGLALALLMFTPAALAESNSEIEKQLNQAFAGKAIFLRTPSSGEKLDFDSNGHCKNQQRDSWTIAGVIAVNRVRMTDSAIEVDGERIVLVYDDQAKQFRSINPFSVTPSGIKILPAIPDKANKKEKRLAEQTRIHVNILQTSQPPTLQSARDLMARVFLRPDEPLSHAVPIYWKNFVRGLDGGAEAASPFSGEGIYQAGNGVILPRVTYQSDPEYSDMARRLKRNATIVLLLVVDREGSVSQVAISKPAGLGLDEKAVESVSSWKFKPGAKDGEPVAIQITVEVAFNLM